MFKLFVSILDDIVILNFELEWGKELLLIERNWLGNIPVCLNFSSFPRCNVTVFQHGSVL